MKEVDPEAAKAYQEKLELKQVEERLRMRHGTGTKYAKNLKRFRNMDDKDTRDAFHQTVLDRQALTKRTQKIGDESSSDLSGSDSDEDQNMSEGEMAEKAITKMKNALESDEESEEHEQSEQSEDDDVIKMDFSKDPSAQKSSKSKKQDKGIQAMKFMQKSEQRQKEQLKADTEYAVGQIREEHSTGGFMNASSKFGSKKLEAKPEITEEISQSKVLEAARRVTGRATTSAQKIEPAQQPQSKKDGKNVQVTFAQNDLSGFNTEKKSIIKNQTGVSEEDNILKSLFVTNPDAADEFE